MFGVIWRIKYIYLFISYLITRINYKGRSTRVFPTLLLLTINTINFQILGRLHFPSVQQIFIRAFDFLPKYASVPHPTPLSWHCLFTLSLAGITVSTLPILSPDPGRHQTLLYNGVSFLWMTLKLITQWHLINQIVVFTGWHSIQCFCLPTCYLSLAFCPSFISLG